MSHCSYFQPPTDDGGSKITRYVIEGRLGNKRSWQQFGRTSNLEFTVSRLQEGEKYSFQVMAENSIGVGEPAEIAKPVIPASKYSVPSKPAAPEVEDIRAESATIMWKPPADDGGTHVTGYHLERATNQSGRWVRINREPLKTLTYDATSLTEGTHYAWRVIAINARGDSEPSDSTDFVAKDPWGTCACNFYNTHVHSSKYMLVCINVSIK